MFSRRHFLKAGGSALAAVAGVGLYTWRVEPHWVEIVRVRMPLPNLPPSLAGRTLLQLSDLHVGPTVDTIYLKTALEQASELAPDFVVVTGDFISYQSPDEYRTLEDVLAFLPRGRITTLASLGNHDFGPGWQQTDVANHVTKVLVDSGVEVLRNRTVEVTGIQFAGLGDYWSPEFRAGPIVPDDPTPRSAAGTLAALDRGKAAIVLCHNPDVLDEPIWSDLRALVLAGHTHGGQCKPPFLPPPMLPIKNPRYAAGRVAIAPGRTLYVNRGLGYLIRARFNARPEMTLFTLGPQI